MFGFAPRAAAKMESAAAAAAYMDEVLALFENVTYSVRKQWKHMAGQGSFWEPILAFIHAVDWTVSASLSCPLSFFSN